MPPARPAPPAPAPAPACLCGARATLWVPCRAPRARSRRCAPAPAPGVTALARSCAGPGPRPRTCAARLGGGRPAGFVARQTRGLLQRKPRGCPPVRRHSHQRQQASSPWRRDVGQGPWRRLAARWEPRGLGSCVAGAAAEVLRCAGRGLARPADPGDSATRWRPNEFTHELRRRPECQVSSHYGGLLSPC